MAGLTKEQRAAKAASTEHAAIEPKSAPKAEDTHLVAMTKDGATLKVHPSCVADHKSIGWVEA